MCLTIPALIENTAQLYPNKIIVRYFHNDQCDHYTYSDFVNAYHLRAEKLIKLDVYPGARIVLIGENSPEILITFFAILAVQGTAVFLDASLPIRDLNQLITLSDPSAIAVTDKYVSLAGQLEVDAIPILKVEDHLNSTSNKKIKHSDQLAVNPTPDTAAILFTSGTTGAYKGVMLSHEEIIFVLQIGRHVTQVGVNDATLGLLPLFHIFPLTNIIGALLCGCEIGFVSSLSTESIRHAMNIIKPTTLILVPRLIEMFKQKIEYRLNRLPALLRSIGYTFHILPYLIKKQWGGRLRLILSGGAPLDPNCEKFYQELDIKIINGYGMSETGGYICSTRLNAAKIGSVGYPAEGCEIKINQPDTDGIGEICYRGPNLMQGYFQDEAATKEMIRDGWLYTGDMGKVDDDGFLYITGRQKNTIVTSSGKKVFPETMEEYFKQIANVKHLAVVGIPIAEGAADEIHMAIELEKPEQPLVETIRNEIRKRSSTLPSYMQIKEIHFVDKIPVTSVMKSKHYLIREQLLKKIRQHEIKEEKTSQVYQFSSKETEHIANEIRVKLAEFIGKNTDEIEFDQSLQHYGIDSIIWMDLNIYIHQRYGIQKNIDVLKEQSTIALLATYIAGSQSKNLSQTIEYVPDARMDKIFLKDKKSKTSLFLPAFKFFSRLIWQLEIMGAEHLPTQMPYLLCANHESHLDPLWILCGLPMNIIQKTRIIGKQEHWESFLTRYIVESFGAVPINRSGDPSEILHLAGEVIQKGNSLIIFPEGTRTRDGSLGKFRHGVARLAIAQAVPIVPIAIRGAYEIYPAHKTLPRLWRLKEFKRFHLQVIFGEPIQPQDESYKDYRALTHRLREAISQLKTL